MKKAPKLGCLFFGGISNYSARSTLDISPEEPLSGRWGVGFCKFISVISLPILMIEWLISVSTLPVKFNGGTIFGVKHILGSKQEQA